MVNNNFSVLMSVYKNDNVQFLAEALDSLMVQSLMPSEIVIVKDGRLTNELDALLEKYKENHADLIKLVGYEENRGLGKALDFGLSHCKYDLVARMDADDISVNDRFEKQLKYFNDNPQVSVVGGYISEFYDSPENSKMIRKVPLSNEEIKKMLIRRNPMNHVSVMFKKKDLVIAGGYMHLLYLEDYFLWVRFANNGLVMENIPNILVNVRTGLDMYKRRGNKVYIYSWKQLQDHMLNYNLINYTDYIINMISIVGFIYLPPKFKEITYKVFLRKTT